MEGLAFSTDKENIIATTVFNETMQLFHKEMDKPFGMHFFVAQSRLKERSLGAERAFTRIFQQSLMLSDQEFAVGLANRPSGFVCQNLRRSNRTSLTLLTDAVRPEQEEAVKSQEYVTVSQLFECVCILCGLNATSTIDELMATIEVRVGQNVLYNIFRCLPTDWNVTDVYNALYESSEIKYMHTSPDAFLKKTEKSYRPHIDLSNKTNSIPKDRSPERVVEQAKVLRGRLLSGHRISCQSRAMKCFDEYYGTELVPAELPLEQGKPYTAYLIHDEKRLGIVFGELGIEHNKLLLSTHNSVNLVGTSGIAIQVLGNQTFIVSDTDNTVKYISTERVKHLWEHNIFIIEASGYLVIPQEKDRVKYVRVLNSR